MKKKTDRKSNKFFSMKNAEAVLRNQLSLATDGLFQMRPTMLDQTDTLSTTKKNTAHLLDTAHALSFYNCVKSDTLRSLDKTVFWQEHFVDVSPSFVGIIQVYTYKSASSLKANATVVYMGSFGTSKLIEKFPQISHRLRPYPGRVATFGDF